MKRIWLACFPNNQIRPGSAGRLNQRAISVDSWRLPQAQVPLSQAAFPPWARAEISRMDAAAQEFAMRIAMTTKHVS